MRNVAASISGIYHGYIARVDIKKGQVLRKLWLRYARPAKDASDTPICGIALADAKKGDEVAVAVKGSAHVVQGAYSNG